MQVASTLLIDRRRFLRAAGAGFVASLSPQSLRAASSTAVIFASAYKAPNGSFGVATLTEQGEVLHRYKLPDRGHDIVSNPEGDQLVAFARRPGTFAAIIDPSHQTPPRLISSVNGRHFYGHGVFSADGKFLFATENDFENARGTIGVYDVTDGFQRISEYDAYGTGPHDIDLLPDNKTIVIANGGIETHPDFPRAKLNIATMAPNLSFIDLETGQLKAQFKLPADGHKLSIRHLTVLGEQVWFACQNEGDVTNAKSLVGSVSLVNGDFGLLELPMTINASLRGYVGSIASNPRTNQIAIT
ncbi:MAG: DUF1513 domain-containing protein, partial [Pseudomonadota bacterium]